MRGKCHPTQKGIGVFATAMAQPGYGRPESPVRTDRGTEYAAFTEVTRRLKSVDETDRLQFPQLAEALKLNQRLWAVLSEDLFDDRNALPVALRAQLASLGEFVRKHTHVVLSGKGSTDILIEINTAVMRGLREGGSR